MGALRVIWKRTFSVLSAHLLVNFIVCQRQSVFTTSILNIELDQNEDGHFSSFQKKIQDSTKSWLKGP